MIFLDNAAGSYPKPQQVVQAMGRALEDYGANPGRGGYELSLRASRAVYQAREKAAEFFGCPNPERLIFTSGATESLNIALFGYLKKGDHVIYSGMEHNALWRPLMRLVELGTITATCVKADRYGYVHISDFQAAIRPQTALICCLHASNVTGCVQPLGQLGIIAASHKIPLLTDVAQSAGLLPISVADGHIALLAFAGHKGLYGPSGIGGLYVDEKIELQPLIYGGTGSNSDQWQQPDYYPDRLESGTANFAGIIGLSTALDFVNECGIDSFFARADSLCNRFIEGAGNIKGITLYLPRWQCRRLPVVSLNIKGLDSAEAAAALDEEYGIAVRSGLHCSPLAHKSIGTESLGGALRFSFGCFNTENQVERVLLSLRSLADAQK